MNSDDMERRRSTPSQAPPSDPLRKAIGQALELVMLEIAATPTLPTQLTALAEVLREEDALAEELEATQSLGDALRLAFRPSPSEAASLAAYQARRRTLHGIQASADLPPQTEASSATPSEGDPGPEPTAEEEFRDYLAARMLVGDLDLARRLVAVHSGPRPLEDASRPSPLLLAAAPKLVDPPKSLFTGTALERDFLVGCARRQADVHRLGTWIHDTFVDLTGAERTSLLLWDRPARRFRSICTQGPHVQSLEAKMLTVGPDSVAYLAARSACPRFGRAQSDRYAGQAYVVLPLVRDGVSAGVVCLTDLPGDRLPDDETLRLWRVLAADSALFLHTACDLLRAGLHPHTDSLTGLPNQRAFHDALERESKRGQRRGGSYGVAVFDIDRFKKVNAEFTHPLADLVLKNVAQELKASFRGGDLVCRTGGDEFAVLLTDQSQGPRGAQHLFGRPPADALLQATERARVRIRQQQMVLPGERNHCAVTVSGGLALHPDDADDPGELVACATAAMQTAKSKGRDRAERYQRSTR